ncbi:Protein involved in membrane traffic (YOP1/TB2/DP1/HVA22 family) [Plasmopara halstedii]|uniref:Protein involved in membrane traffic (YOP1/TB2/DP1/HVA22 family) n=1 Tax=Plasmopara halstedii TaxID=4781 RepID=A0A0P1AXF7_PLAHL|nr:Protein involved in membrane traffic (YOP1/TB2/DP1/HVA22 family) [Plasmopara halstedii]CEG45878.1 Protein involved in membrane traffic (YOP1/TB2/DP1/HVA22 family) [Plasmopara halstedii]|eukprot:XP_024582247.1 Protein involved in membrane traffic (YOP1/TB2/DP1/HVA22 family) [Plasmopara halstedii]
MGVSFSRYLCLSVGMTYPAYASFKALERPESGHDKNYWLTYWIVYGALTSIETVMSPLTCIVPGYNISKTLFLFWMMLPQTKGATIVYDKLLCPYLKKKEPYVDRKLEGIQEAAESALSYFLRAWGQTIADQIVAIQKSNEFKQICMAIKAWASPSLPKKRKKRSSDYESQSKQSASEE